MGSHRERYKPLAPAAFLEMEPCLKTMNGVEISPLLFIDSYLQHSLGLLLKLWGESGEKWGEEHQPEVCDCEMS